MFNLAIHVYDYAYDDKTTAIISSRHHLSIRSPFSIHADPLFFVCPGQQQTLRCSANYAFLEWSVSTTSQPSLRETRRVPYEDQTLSLAPIMINSANFIFSRDSSPRELPLVSTITIMNVNSNLEGTVVSCTGLNSSSESTMVLMTTIHVLDVNTGKCVHKSLF